VPDDEGHFPAAQQSLLTPHLIQMKKLCETTHTHPRKFARSGSMQNSKRLPETTSSPSKLQRYEGQNYVVDVEQPPSHSGTPQSRRSSIDLLRFASNAPSESTFESSTMSNFMKDSLFGTSFEVPQGLIDEINKRNCIAFVGSGFTAPLIGDWNKLLKMLLEDARAEVDDWNLKDPEGEGERDEILGFLLEKADKLRGASCAE
jgi:hypothetical protein